jgi:hypothetical protein
MLREANLPEENYKVIVMIGPHEDQAFFNLRLALLSLYYVVCYPLKTHEIRMFSPFLFDSYILITSITSQVLRETEFDLEPCVC